MQPTLKMWMHTRADVYIAAAAVKVAVCCCQGAELLWSEFWRLRCSGTFMANLIQAIRGFWLAITRQKDRTRPSPEVILHDPAAERPRNLDDPFFIKN